jgi:hypothetical protein
VPDNGHKLDLFGVIDIIDIVDAVAYNNLLLIASERELALFDISDTSSPLLTYTGNDTFSSLVAVSGGFYAFNSHGLTYVNCSNKDNIVFTEIENEDIKQTKRAWLKENNLYIGGPSKYANMSKIAKLDITTPSSPAILYIDDQIQGTAVDFAYDSGLDKLYLAFEAADTATEPEKTILEYTEDLNGFTQTNVLKFKSNSKMGSFYIWNGFFYIDGYNMVVYKLQ